MTVSMYAEPAEYARGRVLVGVGADAAGTERIVLIVAGGGTELTRNECRSVALGLLDALDVTAGETGQEVSA